MTAPKIAILDQDLPARVKMRPEALEGIDVVWSGTSLSAFEAEVPLLSADVIVLNLEYLGEDDPVATVQRLLDDTRAELALTLYAFTPRQTLQRLTGERIRPVRWPVTLEGLRAQMTSLIVRSIIEHRTPTNRRPPTPSRTLPLPELDDDVRGPRFSHDALGRLAELSTSVQCECPNHLAGIIAGLLAFERYSADCRNKNEADAHVHRFLYRKAASARHVMEDALERLLEHEGIDPDRI